MGRRQARVKGNTVSSFVMQPWELLNSKAYIDLKPSASKALPYFLGKPHKHFNDSERYHLAWKFTYGEAKRLGFSSSTFSDIIRDVVAKGFVDPVAKGGLRGDSKSCNKYKLSKRWEKYGTAEFEALDWETFQPG